MIELKNIIKKYNNNIILNNISFKISNKEIVFIIGGSGEGKSTLFKILTFLEQITSGIILYNEKELTKNIAIKENLFGLVTQSFGLFKNLTVIENITIILEQILNKTKKESIEIAVNLLKEFGIDNKQNDYIKNLSGGQKQRVALARAISIKPKLLILDEPTSALDKELSKNLSQLIINLSKEGYSFLITTHDYEFLKLFFNNATFYELKNGNLNILSMI